MRTEIRTTAWRLGARTIQKIRPRPAAAVAALAATATLSAGLAGAPLAQASVTSALPAVTGHHVDAGGPSPAYATQGARPWTRSEMLRARDADVLGLKPGHVKSTEARGARPENAGQPGRVAGAAPTERLAGGIRDHLATPADRRTAADQPPATTTGEIFFTTTGDGQTQYWQCTGTTVNSGGKDVVMTAGHCLYGNMGGAAPGEGWHSDWVFVPDYNNGNAPYGTWTANQLWVPTNYLNSGGTGDEADDIGAAVMNTNASGQHIVDVLGGQGIEWNYSPNQYVYLLYYGSGSSLSYCAGYEFDNGSGTMGLNCPPSNDGGAWLAAFNGEYGYLNGVNSFSYTNQPNYTYSAYFGNNAGSLFHAVAGL